MKFPQQTKLDLDCVHQRSLDKIVVDEKVLPRSNCVLRLCVVVQQFVGYGSINFNDFELRIALKQRVFLRA